MVGEAAIVLTGSPNDRLVELEKATKKMAPFPGTLFGGLFVAAGLLFLLMPAFAPHLQVDNPLALSILSGALFIVVGICTIQIQRDPKAAPLWVGMIGAALGAFIIVMSGLDPDDSRFHAPRWVVAAAGACFVLASVAVIMTRGNEASPVQHSLRYGFILALLLTCFGAVASWVAFGPGERSFEGGFSIGGGVLPFNVGEMLGRILFSPGALLLDIMALAAWFFVFRRLRRRHDVVTGGGVSNVLHGSSSKDRRK